MAGCGGDADADSGGSQIALATYQPTGTGGDGAQLFGELTDHRGCLVIDDVGVQVLPVWPAGQVAVRGSRLDLLGRSYALGDPIEIGGGFAENWAGELPEPCRDLDLEMFVVAAG